MSSKRDRRSVLRLALTHWAEVETILAERGESWPDNTDVTRWSIGLRLAFAEFKAACDALALIGGLTQEQVIDRYREQRTDPAT